MTTYSTIYDIESGYAVSDGEPTGHTALIVARQYARNLGHDVVVEDHGSEECYRVTAAGEREPAPADWTPSWDMED